MNNTELTLDQLSEVSGGAAFIKLGDIKAEFGFSSYLSHKRDFGKTQSVDCWVRRLECVLK